MPRSDLTKVQRTLEEALSEQPINALGRKTGQTKRMRIVTPFRLLRTLLVAMAVGATETLADLCREFTFETAQRPPTRRSTCASPDRRSRSSCVPWRTA